jgi:alpha-ketoglutarate-dependent taurine dioxygenase
MNVMETTPPRAPADAAHEVLNEQFSEAAPRRPLRPLEGPIAWTANSLRPEDGLVRLDPASREELDALVEALRDNPLPIEALDVRDFALPACRRLMAQVKHTLEAGVGFVIIDRLPMEHYAVDEARAVYWLLSQLVARPVAQNWEGRLLYDVRDLGKPPGNGVRPDITNAEQNFHTDNSYNLCAPDYVSLLCVRPALEGGISSIVSFYAVFNEMQRRHPEKTARLFEPYLFDRQREHAPGDKTLISHPLVQLDGERVVFRLSHRHVVNGYRMAGREMDAEGLDALETLEALMREPQFAREFFFEPGQIQIVCNTRCGHRRTGFTDHPEFERKRHLVRLWLRDRGRRFYNG